MPLGKADIKRDGNDLSIVAHGRAVITALEAAEKLKYDHNIYVEVVDLRSIRPLDVDTILESVKKTNHVLLVDENKPFCGTTAQISHIIQSEAFDYLDAPVARVGAPFSPVPFSPALEAQYVPNSGRIVDEVKKMLGV